jgi:hypothetical protein
LSKTSFTPSGEIRVATIKMAQQAIEANVTPLSMELEFSCIEDSCKFGLMNSW